MVRHGSRNGPLKFKDNKNIQAQSLYNNNTKTIFSHLLLVCYINYHDFIIQLELLMESRIEYHNRN